MDEQIYDVIIIGAGAAGLMCAIEAGKRGRRVWLIDHASKIAEKIRISGGGRCNFTNINTSAAQFLSANPHFCKSALQQYTQHDFIALVRKHKIDFHEKSLGQLFCDVSATSGKLSVTADGTLDLSGTLSVESLDLQSTGTTGAITQSAGTLSVSTGAISLEAGGSITLDQANDFGSGILTVVNATDVVLTDVNDLTLGAVSASGTLTVTADADLVLDGATRRLDGSVEG